MLTLYQYERVWGINASPFCMKIETILKHFNLNFAIDTSMQVTDAPNGKFPCIKDEGRIIADSDFIIDYLRDSYGKNANVDLSIEQKAISYAFKKMVEESLYWVMFYYRWNDNWTQVRDSYFPNLPQDVQEQIRNKALGDMRGHGMGLHSRAEITTIGLKTLNAIVSYLADKKYFFGDDTSEIDIVFYAFFANIVFAPIESPIKDFVMNNQNLMNYINRLKSLYEKN